MKGYVELFFESRLFDGLVESAAARSDYAPGSIERSLIGLWIQGELEGEMRRAAGNVIKKYIKSEEGQQELLDRVLAQRDVDKIISELKGEQDDGGDVDGEDTSIFGVFENVIKGFGKKIFGKAMI
mgnify:CR=1 FL=1